MGNLHRKQVEVTQAHRRYVPDLERRLPVKFGLTIPGIVGKCVGEPHQYACILKSTILVIKKLKTTKIF